MIMSKKNMYTLTLLHFTALCWWPKEKKIVRQENALDARFATLQENRGGHLGPIYWGSNQGLDFASTLMEFQAVDVVVPEKSATVLS